MMPFDDAIGGAVEADQTRRLRATVEAYYAGCNDADVEAMIATLSPDAVHYFPAGAPQGPFLGAEAIARGWATAVATIGSQWTIDRLLIDPEAGQHGEAVIEWTHYKTAIGGRLRGVEWCRFDAEGRLSEIRAYYACPSVDPTGDHHLGDFDYEGRGYPMAPARRRA